MEFKTTITIIMIFVSFGNSVREIFCHGELSRWRLPEVTEICRAYFWRFQLRVAQLE